ncbi:hypothetical protein V8D89_003901 [Ganoderma adspersum]
MMRLLHTETGRFVEVTDICGVRYAILSHTWAHDSGEQSYQDILEIQKSYDSYGRRLPSSAASLSSRWLRTVKSQGNLKDARQPTGAFLTPDYSVPSRPSSPRSTSILRSASVEDLVSSGGESSHSPSSPGRSTRFWDDPRLSEKIRRACELAYAHGYQYIWIDSCCIDKSSSSELSEAINSMYLWYCSAHICYAFLAGVSRTDDLKKKGSSFRTSRWFRRGWTLQELIAPELLVFVSAEWSVFGTKATLGALIEDITGIECGILAHKTPLDEVSVAARMSWAAKRETTRIEDQAYSPLGIFDIHMPTLYGEGPRAFRRLQEEILRRIPDQSIFAWTYHPVYTYDFPFPRAVPQTQLEEEESYPELCVFPTLANRRSLLASEPSRFQHSRSVTAIPHDVYLHRLGLPPGTNVPLSEYSNSAHGIRTELLIFPISDMVKYPPDTEAHRWYLMVLPCESSERTGSLLAHICYLDTGPGGIQTVQSGYVSLVESSGSYTLVHVLALSPRDLARFRPLFRLGTVYIPHPERLSTARDAVALPESDLKLTLSPWACALLQGQGYAVAFQGPAAEDNTPSYTLTAASTSVVFEVTFVFTPGTNAHAFATAGGRGGGPRLQATAWCLQVPRSTGPLALACRFRAQKTTFASLGRHQNAPFADMSFGVRTMRLTLESVPGPGITVQLGVEIIESDSARPKTAVREVLKV